MSPEERACDLLNRYSLVWGLEMASDRGLQSMIEAIASAIKEAEDAAYERAILFCEGEAKAKDLPGDDPRFYAGRREAGRRLVRLVRSLKSQEL